MLLDVLRLCILLNANQPCMLMTENSKRSSLLIRVNCYCSQGTGIAVIMGSQQKWH